MAYLFLVRARFVMLSMILQPSTGHAPNGYNGPLRGEYGVLSQFDGVSLEEARMRVRLMQGNFGIMEFQFSNAFGGLTHPPDIGADSWTFVRDGSVIRRDVLRAYIDEIAVWGGRPWLTIESISTDGGDGDAHSAADGELAMNTMALTADWARSSSPEWADFASALGFSGIHWESSDNFRATASGFVDIPGFLNAAKAVLDSRSLGQTFNFPDGFGWDRQLVVDNVVAFTIWSAWRLTNEERLLADIPAGSVLVSFPGSDGEHAGEAWNSEEVGKSPLELITARWKKARCFGDSFLAVGDGLRYVTTDYFPDARPLSNQQLEQVVEQVFANVDSSDCSKLGVPYVDMPEVPELPPQSTEDDVESTHLRATVQDIEDRSLLLRSGRDRGVSAPIEDRRAGTERLRMGAGAAPLRTSPELWPVVVILVMLGAIIGAAMTWVLLKAREPKCTGSVGSYAGASSPTCRE